MCRNIRTLYNFDPPASADEIEAAALQFVRKISGFTRPSQQNQQAFDAAASAVNEVPTALLANLGNPSTPRNRGVPAGPAQKTGAQRFGDLKR